MIAQDAWVHPCLPCAVSRACVLKYPGRYAAEKVWPWDVIFEKGPGGPPEYAVMVGTVAAREPENPVHCAFSQEFTV